MILQLVYELVSFNLSSVKQRLTCADEHDIVSVSINSLHLRVDGDGGKPVPAHKEQDVVYCK